MKDLKILNLPIVQCEDKLPVLDNGAISNKTVLLKEDTAINETVLLNEDSVLNDRVMNDTVSNNSIEHFNLNAEELGNFISQWIPYVAGTFDLPDEQFERRDTLNNFWIDFFYKVYIQNSDQNVSKNENESEFESALLDNPQLFEFDTRTISSNKKLFVRAYRHQVYELLKNAKDKKDDPKELLKLQHKIEDWTLNFNENNMFITAPNVMSMLTKKEKKGLSSAETKRYKPILSDSDSNLLKELGDNTIECLHVHTLSYLFNMTDKVSLASLIDRIESNVRLHASSMQKIGEAKSTNMNKIENEKKESTNMKKIDEESTKKVGTKKSLHYPFGTALVEFLIS